MKNQSKVRYRTFQLRFGGGDTSFQQNGARARVLHECGPEEPIRKESLRRSAAASATEVDRSASRRSGRRREGPSARKSSLNFQDAPRCHMRGQRAKKPHVQKSHTTSGVHKTVDRLSALWRCRALSMIVFFSPSLSNSQRCAAAENFESSFSF